MLSWQDSNVAVSSALTLQLCYWKTLKMIVKRPVLRDPQTYSLYLE